MDTNSILEVVHDYFGVTLSYMLSPFCETQNHKEEWCRACLIKKNDFCSNYQLSDKSSVKWTAFVAKKFSNKAGWAVGGLASFSALDFEYFFRRIYEAVYISVCDDRHMRWSMDLAYSSIVFKYGSGAQYLDQLAMETYVSGRLPNLEFEGEQLGTNYCGNLTYRIFRLLGKCSDTEHLKYLDLRYRPGTQIINRENREDVFYRLDIEFDNARLRQFEGARWYYFGDEYNPYYTHDRLKSKEDPWA